ncbi:hypothetical protein RU639_003408 [Aspergillus parasiticus]
MGILIMPSMLCFSENLPNEEFAEFTTDFCSNSLKVEMTGKVVYYKEHDNGGHLAALECPGELVQDVRELAVQELEEVTYMIEKI